MIIRYTVLLAIVLTGCSGQQEDSTRETASSSAAATPDVATIVSVLAEQFGISPGQVAPDATLASLGADELDVVEIIMTVEERFHVEITDEQIVRRVGRGGAEDTLTARSLAALVAESRSAMGSR